MLLSGNSKPFNRANAPSLQSNAASFIWKASQTKPDSEDLPKKQGIYHSSFHFIFNYRYITPIYYSSFHSIFHYPYITPIYYSSFLFPLPQYHYILRFRGFSREAAASKYCEAPQQMFKHAETSHLEFTRTGLSDEFSVYLAQEASRRSTLIWLPGCTGRKTVSQRQSNGFAYDSSG